MEGSGSRRFIRTVRPIVDELDKERRCNSGAAHATVKTLESESGTLLNSFRLRTILRVGRRGRFENEVGIFIYCFSIAVYQ